MNVLRHRDFIERFLKAHGTRVDPADVPPDLDWRTWRPRTQSLYVWSWTVRDGHLWGLLEDAYGQGGVWRVPFTAALSSAWAAIAPHVGPPGAILLAERLGTTCLGLA